LGFFFYYLYFSHWFEDIALPRSVAQQMIERFFLIYLIFNIAVAFVMIYSRWFSAPVSPTGDFFPPTSLTGCF